MKLQYQEEWSIGNLKRRVNQADPNQDLTTNPEKVSNIFLFYFFIVHAYMHACNMSHVTYIIYGILT